MLGGYIHEGLGWRAVFFVQAGFGGLFLLLAAALLRETNIRRDPTALQPAQLLQNIATLLSDRRDLTDVRDSSTPTAMLGLLRAIDSGEALTPQSRAHLLDLMRRCATGTNRIRGLLPPEARVEHKTGTLNGYTGDVGYLTYPDGRRIAVVFFARGGSNRPGVISTAARAIYDGFGGGGQAAGLAAQAGRVQNAYAPIERSAPAGSACSLGGQAVQAQC